MTDVEYRRFSDWLAEEYGLVFGPEKRDILRSRLEPRRSELGFDTFEQLFFHVKYHPERDSERDKLIPHLTNNESYFFREREQLAAFGSEVLPGLRDRLAAQKRHEVRVLSAGCAAGEEAYSLAIAVHESNLFPADWKVRLTGIDLDPEALERARAGRYTQNAFRRLDPSIKAKYFTSQDDGMWELNDRIRQMVTFQRANLADRTWPASLRRLDVIFCRNVLIYFGEATTRQVAEAFHDALVPGGYLFLGHSESLSRVPTRLEAVRRPGTVFYRRPEKTGE
ncbi:MAG: protein-glutamate O-methyltransferase CheR [Gemmatimonadota bacterium]